MSILVRFSPQGLTADQYDEVQRRVEESGQWPPEGLEYQVSFGESGQLKVSQIWSSGAQFEAFGPQLMPILAAAGVTLAGPPEVMPVHNQQRF